MTLVEIMAALAITTSIIGVIGSVLFSTFSSGRSLTRQTDGYESLRLAGAAMMNDARFAFRAECGWDYLKLLTSPSTTDYLVYKFAAWDGDPSAGTPDPQHLHRWEVLNSVLQRDDVVGWNLIPPDINGSYEATGFDCSALNTNRMAYMHLVKPPFQGQTSGAHMDFRANLR